MERKGIIIQAPVDTEEYDVLTSFRMSDDAKKKVVCDMLGVKFDLENSSDLNGNRSGDVNYRLLELRDSLGGLYTLLNRFYEDSILNTYNIPEDKDVRIKLYTSIYPLVINTLNNSVDELNRLSDDVDMFLTDKGGA